MSKLLYQFKITLKGIEPPIWRRIQTKDCTLDKLHEHIQTVMGWQNCHLHLFKIDDQVYSDPLLMEEDFVEQGHEDSTETKLSQLLAKNGPTTLIYEYDFGDGWKQEVYFEGNSKPTPGVEYPLCLEGERACPPEDVGGVHGYEEYCKAMANRSHKRHQEFLEWRGPFDPEAFDADETTNRMREGLPEASEEEEEWLI
ncbi:MAG: plasmid pRiA4b ORF-3 family protein [Planctomycetota bacterium]